MQERIITYAQNREDIILAGFFTDIDKGFYVDVGAHDPVVHSVTKYFYERGWRGINIEPNKVIFKKLAADRVQDININVGIAEKPGKLKLRIYDDGDGLSTFSEKMQGKYGKQKHGVTARYHDEIVNILTLKEVFDQQKVSKINFLKVDVEGYEYEVLAGNDWEVYRPEIISIEANHIIKDWRKLLASVNYTNVFFDGLNEYYVAKEAKNRADNFSYVQAVIGREVISPKWEEDLNKLQNLEAESLSLKSQVQALHKLNSELEETVTFLHRHIHEQLRSKNLVKNLLIAIDRKILRNLNKITRKPHYYPSIQAAASFLADPKKILTLVREADRKSYAGTPGIGWKILTAFGGMVLFVYIKMKRLVARSARLLIRKALRRRP